MKASDADDFHAIRTEIEMIKWTSQTVPDIDIEATRAWMSPFMPPNDNENFIFCIEEHASPGKVVGSIGAHKFSPPEFGYMIGQQYWGKGYATEAARAFLAIYWALERRLVDVEEEQEHEILRAATDVSNKRSRNVLQKCGFKYVGEGEGYGRAIARYYLEAPALA